MNVCGKIGNLVLWHLLWKIWNVATDSKFVDFYLIYLGDRLAFLAWFLLPSVPSFASGAVRTLWKKLCFLVNRILNKNLIECANIFTSNFISLRLRSRVPSKTCPFVIIFHVTASPNLYTNRLSRNILAPQFEVKSSNMWLLARVLTWDRTVTVSCDR